MLGKRLKLSRFRALWRRWVPLFGMAWLVSGCLSGDAGALAPGIGSGSGSGGSVASGPFPEFATSMNTARAGPGLNPLGFNARLAAAAQVHADDMSTNGFFSHVGSDGSTFDQRILAQGYNYAWAAENIAWGYATQQAVFTAWMNSPGHRANMMSAEPTEFGLAWAPGNYWVLEMARPN